MTSAAGAIWIARVRALRCASCQPVKSLRDPIAEGKGHDQDRHKDHGLNDGPSIVVAQIDKSRQQIARRVKRAGGCDADAPADKAAAQYACDGDGQYAQRSVRDDSQSVVCERF